MNTNSSQNIISMKKLLHNFRKRSWILGIIVALAIGISVMSAREGNGIVYMGESALKISTERIEGLTPVTVNIEGVTQEFNIYLSTEEIIDKINKNLSKMSYEMFSQRDIPTYEITNNIIKMRIKGHQEQRTEYVSKLLVQEFEEYINVYNEGLKCDSLNVEVKEETTQTTFTERFISMKSIFIILLGVILGAGVIVICAFFDDKVYIKEDLSCFKELVCLYVVEKGTREKDTVDVTKIIEYYKDRENKTVQIWTLQNDNRYRDLVDNDEIVKFSDEDSVEKITSEKDKIIFLFAAGKTKKKEIEKILHFQRGLGKECLGYVLVE